MSTEQNKALANRVVDGINQKNLSVLDEVIAADAVDLDAPLACRRPARPPNSSSVCTKLTARVPDPPGRSCSCE